MATVDTDEIELKDLVGKTKMFLGYLWKWKAILFIVTIIGGAIGLWVAVKQDPVYKAKLTFVLANDSKSSGGLASLVGQLGMDAGNGNGAFEGDNIIELLKSRTILKGAFFKPIGKSDSSLINLIGDRAGFFENWKKSEYYKRLIPFPAKEKLVGVQDSLVDAIHSFVLKKYLEVEKPEKKLSFYTVTVSAPAEVISVNMAKALVEEASKMYIETKTKVAKENLLMMQHEADSLRRKLGSSLYSTASVVDQTFNLNAALQMKRTPVQQGQLEVEVLAAAYGEVLKNLELAKINLQKATPLYQVIDEPFAPLVKIKMRKSVAVFIGGVIGFVVCSIFLFARQAYLFLKTVK